MSVLYALAAERQLEAAAAAAKAAQIAHQALPAEDEALMSSRAENGVETSTPVALAAHEDARPLIRLIQCPLCSRPFRTPVTLPCGNTLCRQCLPGVHDRTHVSYPDVPGRRTAITCPFGECGKEHPSADCSIDVVMTKTMDAIAEIVAKQMSVAVDTTTLVQEQVRWDECVSGEPVADKACSQTLPGGRLVATYALAAKGDLYRASEVRYEVSGDAQKAMDMSVLHEVLEATQSQVECQVCYGLMLDPVTTFCGHTLCRKCLTRTLDHSLHCPVCRRGLGLPPSLIGQPSNKTLVDLLNALCPDAVALRFAAAREEEAGGPGELNTPLFVCSLGFPNMPVFLRIFEPRYRLMLRRSLESNREFGMLMYNRYGEPQGDLGSVHFYQYGTMLHIDNHQLLADGTSLIESRGAYRFRVRAHGIHDGYAVGNVERLDDVPTTEEERLEAAETSGAPVPEWDVVGQLDRMSTQALLDLGRSFIERMRGRSANWLQQRVLDIHGQPPTDPALFPFWFASVLPISDEEKYKLLPTRTVRARLKIIAGWIRRIESQRWVGHSIPEGSDSEERDESVAAEGESEDETEAEAEGEGEGETEDETDAEEVEFTATSSAGT
ncbi:hypothetical protein B0A48_06615 [Cryoendolithus antarcticus]|uniref:RING-type domain-containing protein n=1 Tax=Cryoendolithus antarcticus TaxID=1507870 RepID=A0A1V8T973_9PEZI|nr:hypothetical protein B0A48_06615 [Cryoendolithus antarcticus]